MLLAMWHGYRLASLIKLIIRTISTLTRVTRPRRSITFSLWSDLQECLLLVMAGDERGGALNEKLAHCLHRF
jgi:hypothetical protein